MAVVSLFTALPLHIVSFSQTLRHASFFVAPPFFSWLQRLHYLGSRPSLNTKKLK